MDLIPWTCCRTCSSDKTLYDIFRMPEEQEKYTKVLYQVTGLKILPNDLLPQQMCKPCIQHINNFIEFRSRSLQTNTMLTEKLRIEIKQQNDNFSNCYADDDKKDLNLESNDVIFTKTEKTMDKGTAEIFESNIECILKKEQSIIIPETFNFSKIQLYYSNGENKDRKIKTKETKLNKKLLCKFCNQKFSNKIILYNHYKVHKAKIICEHCGGKFATRRKLLMHCRAKHGYEKIDKCSYCDYKASNAELVKIHERTHTGEQPHVCACGAKFRRRSCYLQHTHIHRPHATVPCDECPAMFKSVTLMKIHKRKHKTKFKRNFNIE